MLEQIYCKKINLDGERNFTMDVTNDNAVHKKKVWPVKNIFLVAFQ